MLRETMRAAAVCAPITERWFRSSIKPTEMPAATNHHEVSLVTTVDQRSFFGIPFELELELGYSVRSAEFFPLADGWQPTTEVDLIGLGTPSSWAIFTVTEETVDLTGTVEDAGGTPLCALALASGQFMFTCNPNGPYSLLDLPTEGDGTVKRQVYVDGVFPDSAGKRIDASGTVLLQNTATPVCAMALGNGQFGFTCDGTGNYMDASS